MYEDLTRALRCTKNENADCRPCKYQVLHEGGYDYCDQERLEIDAAEAIKTLDAELADANESIRLAAEASKTIEANYKMQLARVTDERDEVMPMNSNRFERITETLSTALDYLVKVMIVICMATICCFGIFVAHVTTGIPPFILLMISFGGCLVAAIIRQCIKKES